MYVWFFALSGLHMRIFCLVKQNIVVANHRSTASAMTSNEFERLSSGESPVAATVLGGLLCHLG
jgi:hypothetical protein